MPDLPTLLLELEAAVNAVEPRVFERYNSGLSDREIDEIMEKVPFKLPDDLRALCRWKNGCDGAGYGGFLGDFWWLASLPPDNGHSDMIGELWMEDLVAERKPFPDNLKASHLFQLFGDATGCLIFVSCFEEREIQTEIYQADKGHVDTKLMFLGVEMMIRTALEWWQNGVFHSPYEHRFGWSLKTDNRKYFEIGRRLNPGCNYWFE